MTAEEIKLRQLAGQYLVYPADTQTVVKDLCGIQSQFLTYALHGLAIRCDQIDTVGLIKSWATRGTMHVFSVDDLPLFLHEGRTHFLRPVDTMEADTFISAGRKAYFADLIISAISQGINERDTLKRVCERAGMTDIESQSLFNPWGGIIRALCECGRICHKVEEKKTYQLCPPFEPMEEAPACLELARRYFTHFGPATIRDAAYFFGKSQIQVKNWLAQLPVTETQLNGKSYFYIKMDKEPCGELPSCLFLAGFDQLMLGYEKTESLYLPQEHLRSIFNLGGIVRPAILVNGQVVGWWNKKNHKLKITLFTSVNQNPIAEAATQLWDDLKHIEF